MDENAIKVVNPYERNKIINERLTFLGKEEKELNLMISKGINKLNNKKRLNENISEQFYLIIEQECLKNAMSWFEIYYLGYLKAKEEISK